MEAIGRKEKTLATRKDLATIELCLSPQCEAFWVSLPSSLLVLGEEQGYSVAASPSRIEAGRANFQKI